MGKAIAWAKKLAKQGEEKGHAAKGGPHLMLWLTDSQRSVLVKLLREDDLIGEKSGFFKTSESFKPMEDATFWAQLQAGTTDTGSARLFYRWKSTKKKKKT